MKTVKIIPAILAAFALLTITTTAQSPTPTPPPIVFPTPVPATVLQWKPFRLSAAQVAAGNAANADTSADYEANSFAVAMDQSVASGATVQFGALNYNTGATMADSSGNLWLNAPTGYLIIYDQTGTPYYVSAATAP